MGNKSAKKSSHESQTSESYDITIKHFPLKLENSSIKGTLTLDILEPFMLVFLDPTSPEGQESIELDMKVSYAGKRITSELQKRQRCARLTKKTFSVPDIPQLILDDLDNSINLNLMQNRKKSEKQPKNMTYYEMEALKYQFKIECQNIDKFDQITIEFCMPSLLGKRNLDQVTAYEKPGRVAATSTITINDILESRKSIPVISN